MVAAALLPPILMAAAVIAGPPTAASVTIYRDRDLSPTEVAELDPGQGLAMITETRVVDLAAGRQRIAFRGVADTLVPETVAIEGLPGRVVERNEDTGVLSPGALVARSLGRPVQVVQTDRKTGRSTTRTAILRSGPNGVLLDFGGKVEALGCGGPPTRLIFDRAPEGLSDKPTFSVVADAPAAGRYTVKLSYLATGFTWSADYVARIRPDGRTLDLDGWLTLANKTAAGFAQAPTAVVAGQLERDAATRPPEVVAEPLSAACWPTGPSPTSLARFAVPAVEHRIMEPAPPSAMVSEIVVTSAKLKAVQSELGDYKLYTLPEPTTVAARQTKQVAFLEEHAVPFERLYVYHRNAYGAPDPDDPPEAPQVVLRLQNKKDRGLGKPLPAGNFTVMETAAGAPAVAGQHAIENTAVGLPVELTLGQAMDVGVTLRVDEESHRGKTARQSVTATLVNAKPAPVVLEFHQPRQGDDFQILRASHPHAQKAGDEVFTLRLAPGQRTDLTYTVSVRD